jgi:DNA-binding YbaB/EbfC family protein
VSDQFDINSLLNQAMEMQSQLMEAQAEAAQAEVVGRAGGGAVEVTVTGSMEFRGVRISPDAVDPDDVAELEDLVLAALTDAMAQLEEVQRSSMGGLDLGALGGMSGLDLGGGGGGGLPGFGGALDVSGSDADDEDDDAG